ncbi:hypothetical protein Leryth_016046 [Lithospermum erythrorhizon]|nr:hypothetical protein Leryth_016046 [Lithospermum erythrorhizon]
MVKAYQILVSLLLIIQAILIPWVVCLCRNFCNNIPINYPFGIDDGCGAPQYRHMFNCSSPDLFFLTPSGAYKVQSIDYKHQNIVIFDPSMSTCSILQPQHDFLMSDIQSAIIPPSPETIFVLMNCSIDSPILHHYNSLCFNFSGHSCDELYGACTSFRVLRTPSTYSNFNDSSSSSVTQSPGCCFTGYGTVKFMSMNMLDCTHYTTVYDSDDLKGVGPMDWLYGIRLSFAVPDTGCERCAKSSGSCGFHVETLSSLCICSPTVNSTRECGGGTNRGYRLRSRSTFLELLLVTSIISVVIQ